MNKTERLTIKIMERRDLEGLRVMHNEDDVLLKLSDPMHVSEVQQDGWFNSASTSKTSKRYVARRTEDDALVGVFRVDAIDFVNGNCFVGCDIDPKFQGQGYAKEFYKYMLDYIFGSWRMHKVQLVTLEFNERAIGLYTKLGFVKEGVNRQSIFRGGKYHDLIAMGMLASEWNPK